MLSRQCHREKLSEFPIFPEDTSFMSSRKKLKTQIAMSINFSPFFLLLHFLFMVWWKNYLSENVRRNSCLEHLERFPLESRAKWFALDDAIAASRAVAYFRSAFLANNCVVTLVRYISCPTTSELIQIYLQMITVNVNTRVYTCSDLFC